MNTKTRMRPRIHVINASSRTDTGITEELARSLRWGANPSQPEFHCVTLEDGPAGITTARDSAEAVPPVLRYIESQHDDASCAGFIVACFSDPGVYEAREITRKPVIGIGGAGLAVAAALGRRIGTIGVSAKSGTKVQHLARQYGMTSSLSGHRDLGLNYADLQTPVKVTDALVEAGKSLHDEDDVQVLLLAGAGLAQYVRLTQEATHLPVVDPTQAAAGMMLGQVMAARSSQ